MASSFRQLMAAGAQDLLRTAGCSAVIRRLASGVEVPAQAVLTAQSGQLQVELGTSIYDVTAHAVINQAATPGDTLTVEGSRYLILAALQSPHEAVWRCDLSLCPK